MLLYGCIFPCYNIQITSDLPEILINFLTFCIIIYLILRKKLNKTMDLIKVTETITEYFFYFIVRGLFRK